MPMPWEPIKEQEKPYAEAAKLINTAHDAALKYIEDSPFSPEEVCSIHPDVFFTPIINFISSQDTEILEFYKMDFIGKHILPIHNKLYYFIHPVKARREMLTSQDSGMWKKYLLGWLLPVYSHVIPLIKALVQKLRAAKARCIYFLHAEHINRAYDLAGDYPVISFDVFDTLVFRKCTCYQVFDIAAEKYNAVHTDKTESFREHRIKAQAHAQGKSLTQEITLNEIYDELADEYGDVFAEGMKSAEINAELEAVYPNTEMLKFYNAMKSAGKRIIITSDMYLPGKVIAALLEKCGYYGYENLYVSSEYRVRKSSGALFRRIVRDEGIDPSDILHIGDNMHSDYVMANREGLRGFLYKK